MKHLPRPVADLICLWRDLAHRPREVLLNRNHHQWRAAGLIALFAVPVALEVPRFGGDSLLPAVVIAGPSCLLDVLGTLAHGLWQSGRIWQDIECQCCGGPGDDGDDDTDPDDPTDDGGLARDVENWLKGQPTTNA